MAGINGFTGKEVPLEISFDNTNWIRFGAVRGKTSSNSVETADATADDSGDYREPLETFISGTNSWDGIVKTDARGATLDRFEAFFYDPSLENDASGNALTRRCFYMRLIRPKTNDQNRTVTRQVQLTSFEIGAPYDDVTTYSMETQTITDPTVADA